MHILPAIDLLGGRCVRLMQGRYDRVIDYESDPLEVAARFRAAGATWLHVIDLDGARGGRIENLTALASIVKSTGARVQFGGGVRDEAAIDAALAAGAERIIVGTRALMDWEWFRATVHAPRYAGRVALGLDARLGKLATNGWTAQTEQTALDVARAAAGWPLAAIVYTDIGRDGLLLGPNIRAIEALAGVATAPVIASGGISDLEDVRHLAGIGLAGAVIGRAIYERRIDLAAALDAAR
ncbi:MAG: 1-(5-phosphoribosyl)-5-[(5-phosphoribosylamino)methylideneamino]imidazole-4-carboxamide isomerase [Planctomycetota bacterium]